MGRVVFGSLLTIQETHPPKLLFCGARTPGHSGKVCKRAVLPNATRRDLKPQLFLCSVRRSCMNSRIPGAEARGWKSSLVSLCASQEILRLTSKRWHLPVLGQHVSKSFQGSLQVSRSAPKV